jgi:serine/threonine-protein kinase
MYIGIIIFVVIVLLAIVVVINFADSDVPGSVRLIASSIIIIILAAGVYYLAAPVSSVTSSSIETTDSLFNSDTLTDSSVNQEEKLVNKKPKEVDYPVRKNIQSPLIKPDDPVKASDTSFKQTKIHPPKNDSQATGETTKVYGKYKVKSQAYFHNKPDESTRRKAFIIHWNNAVLTPSNEQDGFIYVTFTNHLGQTSKGWLLKSDLRKVD